LTRALAVVILEDLGVEPTIIPWSSRADGSQYS
jgi:hypothetical protein